MTLSVDLMDSVELSGSSRLIGFASFKRLSNKNTSTLLLEHFLLLNIDIWMDNGQSRMFLPQKRLNKLRLTKFSLSAYLGVFKRQMHRLFLGKAFSPLLLKNLRLTTIIPDDLFVKAKLAEKCPKTASELYILGFFLPSFSSWNLADH